MIFGRWGTTKTIKELRKARRQLSLRYSAMSKEELYQNEQMVLEWWAKMTGRPAKVVDNTRK